jgi:hypothetical protein
MTGARPQAETELADALHLTPKDKLAEHYLGQLKSNLALTPPTPQQIAPQSQQANLQAPQMGGQPQAVPQSPQTIPQPPEMATEPPQAPTR